MEVSLPIDDNDKRPRATAAYVQYAVWMVYPELETWRTI